MHAPGERVLGQALGIAVQRVLDDDGEELAKPIRVLELRRREDLRELVSHRVRGRVLGGHHHVLLRPNPVSSTSLHIAAGSVSNTFETVTDCRPSLAPPTSGPVRPTSRSRELDTREASMGITRTMTTASVAALLALTLGGVGCGNEAAHGHVAGPGSHAKAHFGYTGATAPSHWGALSEDWWACGAGRAQSPIDLTSAVKAELPDLEMDYKSTGVHIVNNGHSVQLNYEKGSTLSFNEDAFALLQFHFHAPSAHTVDGKHFDMEMHLVHRSPTGERAVIGVFIKEGKENAAFAPIWDHLPQLRGPVAVVPGMRIDVDDLLPADKNYYSYVGSLTTPPCTEGVLWKVLATPIELSRAQIDAFRAIYRGNNRPVQPLYGRAIYRN